MEEATLKTHKMEFSLLQYNIHFWHLHGKVDIVHHYSHGTSCQNSWSQLLPWNLCTSAEGPRNDSGHHNSWRYVEHLIGRVGIVLHCSPCSCSQCMFWHLLAKHIVILQLHTIHRMDLVVLPCNSRPPRLQGLRPVRNSMIQWSWHLPGTTDIVHHHILCKEGPCNLPHKQKLCLYPPGTAGIVHHCIHDMRFQCNHSRSLKSKTTWPSS